MYKEALAPEWNPQELFEKYGSSFGMRFKQVAQFREYMLGKPRFLEDPPTVEVHWGRTGTGKTTYCIENHRSAYWPVDTRWFDGYNGEDTIVFDEFRGRQLDEPNSLSLANLLRLLDRGPFLAPVKGGFVHIRADKFIFTSNIDPKDWYIGQSTEEREALLRRITLNKEYI